MFLDLSCPEETVLWADKRWLYRALANLLHNALEHTPERGRIEVCATIEKGVILFQVCNTGSTIPREYKSKVFEPFFTTREEGFGLGLYLVKQIAEAHGGRVNLRTPPGKVCLEIEIPQKSGDE